jgi:hypothetical protein
MECCPTAVRGPPAPQQAPTRHESCDAHEYGAQQGQQQAQHQEGQVAGGQPRQLLKVDAALQHRHAHPKGLGGGGRGGGGGGATLEGFLGRVGVAQGGVADSGRPMLVGFLGKALRRRQHGGTRRRPQLAAMAPPPATCPPA